MKKFKSAVLLLGVITSASVHAADCVLLQALDGSLRYESDAAECARATSPASTYKLPHTLIALGTGVVTDPAAKVKWDGTRYSNALWNQDHSMYSAVQWSVVWFFQRTAALIGRERMLAGLKQLDYAADSYDGEQTRFWLNGDLQVTPHEQLRFLLRLVRNELPVPPGHTDILKRAFLMPPGKVTMAQGEHDFVLKWHGLGDVHAKSGNAMVNDESVSWLVGYFGANGKQYVFVARRRAQGTLPVTAGADLAREALNTHMPK